ncbi:MAG: YdeI/OmpD-associated family protein [Rhodoglobus sp.]
MASFADKPLLTVDSVEEWERWIVDVGHPDGVRLRLRRKASTLPGILYDEALEVALCHGWIDGQKASLNEDYHVQAFTPRRAASPWSQRNRDIVGRLITEGRMRPAGQAEIDRAQQDGRWDAAYRIKDAPVPPDFQSALDANPAAAAFFATLTGQARFAFLFRIGTVKREDTRARKIAEFTEILARGETLR